MTERRSGEQTRRLLLDIGITMLLQRGVTAAVSHIRLQDVLRRAGLTSGAAYRLWPDQDAFHRDLAAAATRFRLDEPATNTMARIGPLLAASAPLTTVVRVAADEHIDGLERGEPTPFMIALTLRATAMADPKLQEASQRRHAHSVEQFGELYGQLMERYGLVLRPGRTLAEFTEAMAALGEGFALHAIEGLPHPRVTGPDGETWTLFGVCTWDLMRGFTDATV